MATGYVRGAIEYAAARSYPELVDRKLRAAAHAVTVYLSPEVSVNPRAHDGARIRTARRGPASEAGRAAASSRRLGNTTA